MSLIGAWIWWFLPIREIDLTVGYPFVIAMFAGSALIQGLTEPIAILSIKLGDNAHYALANAMPVLLHKLLTVLLLILRVDALLAYSLSLVSRSIKASN